VPPCGGGEANTSGSATAVKPSGNATRCTIALPWLKSVLWKVALPMVKLEGNASPSL
jgi:hypothetical protein